MLAFFFSCLLFILVNLKRNYGLLFKINTSAQ
jgi:hypothetical protein